MPIGFIRTITVPENDTDALSDCPYVLAVRLGHGAGPVPVDASVRSASSHGHHVNGNFIDEDFSDDFAWVGNDNKWGAAYEASDVAMWSDTDLDNPGALLRVCQDPTASEEGYGGLWGVHIEQQLTLMADYDYTLTFWAADLGPNVGAAGAGGRTEQTAGMGPSASAGSGAEDADGGASQGHGSGDGTAGESRTDDGAAGEGEAASGRAGGDDGAGPAHNEGSGDDGCGCRTTGSQSCGGWGWLVGLGALVGLRRRRP